MADYLAHLDRLAAHLKQTLPIDETQAAAAVRALLEDGVVREVAGGGVVGHVDEALVEKAARLMHGGDPMFWDMLRPDVQRLYRERARAVLDAVLPDLTPAVDRDALAMVVYNLEDDHPGAARDAYVIADALLASGVLRECRCSRDH